MTTGAAVYPSLAGRTVLVTGGGSGIGAAIVESFARQKAKVGFVDIDATASAQLRAGLAGMVAYTAAKSAVLGLTRSLARDFGRYNIRVNAIAPGWVLTERQRKLWLTPEGHARLLESQCLKRELNGDDIARVVLFLASDEAGAITSQQYVVDGGRL